MYYKGGQPLSHGSCFFWVHAGRTFLVTNWHNLSGRNSDSGQPLHSMAALPDRITFWTYKQVSKPDADGYFQIEYVPVEVILCDEHIENHRWFEHPKFSSRVDIGAIDITELIVGLAVRHANEVESDAILPVTASQDVFILGFPFGRLVNAPAPIWKRGTVALDPAFDPDGLPKILVDSATREGMSGSVVIARHIIAGGSVRRKDGTQSGKLIYARKDLVIGIYSGRHYPDLEKAQLGIVWKRSAIEETVQARQLVQL
jgi:hypothetical protein